MFSLSFNLVEVSLYEFRGVIGATLLSAHTLDEFLEDLVLLGAQLLDDFGEQVLDGLGF